MEYTDLVRSSILKHDPVTVKSRVIPDVARHHQKVAVNFALEQGRAALFLDTGLGKSLCSFIWADNVIRETGLPVIMFAPLGVVGQHAKEAQKFGYSATICRSADDVKPGINLANYERIHLFDPATFGGVILDESSCIKNYSGIMTRRIMEFGQSIKFRLACTATPAPNDHMELGQHCQFLGIMSSSEMLARWFLADQSEMGRYRLKKHAVKSFWQWVASWARCAERPSDLGGDDTGYILPELIERRHIVEVDMTGDDGELFRSPVMSATAIHKEKRLTSGERASRIAEIVAADPDEPWLIWCETDYDADSIKDLLPSATEVHGRMKPEEKEKGLSAFSDGEAQILITKPSVAGWGLNWQHCARMAFVGLSFSYEMYYQAVRRCWRYGQTRPVHVHIAAAQTESNIWQTISRKKNDHNEMKSAMRKAMTEAVERRSTKNDYNPKHNGRLPHFIGVK